MKTLNNIKVALLVNGDSVPCWQFRALDLAMASGIQVPLILICKTSSYPKPKLKNALYYILNIFVMKRGLEMSKRQLAELPIRNPEFYEFNAEKSERKGWQRLPKNLAAKVKEHGCSMVIKFGMGLVDNPDDCGAPHGMLSFHHGDPSKYRGRPAGFWEILNNEPVMGFMVQKLTDKLDAGHVLAFGETTVSGHSYARTLDKARGLSSLLLIKAIQASLNGITLPKGVNGRNYRLPCNYDVLRFLGVILKCKISRIFYGLFMEKSWKVGISKHPPSLRGPFQPTLPVPLLHEGRHVFYADPFWTKDGKVLVEALRRGDGRGEILEIGLQGTAIVSDYPAGHWSYPFTFQHDGEEYVLPEVANWSAPFVLKKGQSSFGRIMLKGLEGIRITDPTLFRIGDNWYLLGTSHPFENSVLRLWISRQSPFGPFNEHPSSPLVINDRGARMAGPIFSQGDNLYRFGQDFTKGYGAGIVVHKISFWDENRYAEDSVGDITFLSVKGPHTIAISEHGILYDWYVENPSLFAWKRRISSAFSSSKSMPPTP